MCRVENLPLAHYVAYNEQELLALVIGLSETPDGTLHADLVVFTNMLNVAGNKNFGMQFYQDVEFSLSAARGTWHWLALEKTTHDEK